MLYLSGPEGNSQQNPFQYQINLQQIEFERYQNARFNLNPWNEVAEKRGKKLSLFRDSSKSLIKEWKENVTELESNPNGQ